jgi:cytochrome c oxidase cbb3-type subunit 1
VHSGALGWNGMVTFGALYYLVPRLWNRLRSIRCAWSTGTSGRATLGIVFYAASMWVAGITQGLMWREYGADGYLVNSFAETVAAIPDVCAARLRGPALPDRRLIMTYNIWRTIAVGDQRDEKPLHNIDQNRGKDGPSRPARRRACRIRGRTMSAETKQPFAWHGRWSAMSPFWPFAPLSR